MDINVELFKRTRPAKKIEIINGLKKNELLKIKFQTIARILKEVGWKVPKTRQKTLRFGCDNPVGNNWNSTIERLHYYNKDKIDIDFYVQYSSTDTTITYPLEKFLKSGEFRGYIDYEDRYGGDQTAYFTYDDSDKARVIRRICLEYIKTKYNE